MKELLIELRKEFDTILNDCDDFSEVAIVAMRAMDKIDDKLDE